MTDPRLNSLHLDPARRDQYRHARDALLGSRGDQTLCAERADDNGPSSLIIREPDQRAAGQEVPPDLECWLADSEFIYPLKVGINTMGRSHDNDVVVQDAYVSRRHCAILVHKNSTCELHDTASKNGTYLNGNRLAGPTLLHPGDEIRICDRQYVFLTKPSAGEASSPSATLVE
jgi:hypothetical protein